MKDISNQLKLIAETLSLLTKQFEQLSSEVNKIKFPPLETEDIKTASQEEIKGVTGKTPPPAAKVKKGGCKTKTAGSRKKTADKVRTRTKKALPILATIYDMVNSSREGVSIAELKEKTDFTPRQISNALYKLSNIQGKIKIKSRGIYVARKK